MKRADPKWEDYRALEVAWYRKHGKHKDRIARERTAPHAEYVVGDWSWNLKHPGRQETIEPDMNYGVCYDLPPAPEDETR